MAPIAESIEISRTPDDVFSYVTDPARLPEWQESVVSVRREDEVPRNQQKLKQRLESSA